MITPSVALNLIAWTVCVCVCVCDVRERWSVAERGDGWMCAHSPMSCRYAAQSSIAIKRVEGLDAKTGGAGAGELWTTSAELNTVLICALTVPENRAMYF